MVRIQSLALIAVSAATLAGGPARASAEEDPALTSVEARFGYGLAFGGGAGGSIQRLSPLTIAMVVDHAVVAEPWTSMFAGVIAEGNGQGAAGIIVGGRVRPGRGRLRISGGAEGLLFPSTLFGPLASVGTCLSIRDIWNFCGDVQATLFVAGSDLPDQRIAGQAQLVLGIGFDAW